MLSDKEKRREVQLPFPRSTGQRERDGLTRPFLACPSTTSLLSGLLLDVQYLLDNRHPQARVGRLDPRTTLGGLLQAVRALSTLQRNIKDGTTSSPRKIARRTRSRIWTHRSTRTDDGNTGPSTARARTTSQSAPTTGKANLHLSPQHPRTNRLNDPGPTVQLLDLNNFASNPFLRCDPAGGFGHRPTSPGHNNPPQGLRCLRLQPFEEREREGRIVQDCTSAGVNLARLLWFKRPCRRHRKDGRSPIKATPDSNSTPTRPSLHQPLLTTVRATATASLGD